MATQDFSSPAPPERAREVELRVAWCAAAGAGAVAQRLTQLEREWDVDRALAAWAAGVSVLGLALSVRNRRWLVLPTAVAAFLTERVVQGWCPQVSVLRRLGFRSRQEIDEERFALKALRGDFADLPQSVPPSGQGLERILGSWRR